MGKDVRDTNPDGLGGGWVDYLGRFRSAKFNRISHEFVRVAFLKIVERAAAGQGVTLVKVNPPFTLIIGIAKCQQQFGLSNHEAAGYVIGRRGLGTDAEKVPLPLV